MEFTKHEGTAKLTHPTNDRSSEPIAEQLRKNVENTASGQWLEIASGCGQHMAYFAPLFPNITFQPSEFDRNVFESIAAYANDCPTKNMQQPIFIDISKDPSEWIDVVPVQSLAYMYNCNTIHTTPWECCEGLFRAAGKLLKSGGKLFMYGPFAVDGVLEPESNVKFDQFLKSKYPSGGIRDLTEMKRVAASNQIQLSEVIEMPANNKFLVWTKS